MKMKKLVIKLNKFYLHASIRYRFIKKIRKIIKERSIKNLTKEQKREVDAFYRKNGFKNVNYSWHMFYSNMNNEFHKNYIPEDIYYAKIEPTFNRVSMEPGLLDKNNLSILFYNG